MIVTAYLPPPLFGNTANGAGHHGFHNNYTDLTVLATLVRQQSQKEALPLAFARPSDVAPVAMISKPAERATSCACTIAVTPGTPTCTSPGIDERPRQRRVSFREPIQTVHEIERLPERRTRSTSSLEELERRLIEQRDQKKATPTPTVADEDAERLEEQRWKMAIKLARCVGVAYLTVSFGTSEDDIFEVECDVANANGHHCESLDEIFDFTVLEDHHLV